MTQNTQLTQEEIRDELLSLYEENEAELTSQVSKIEKIEDASMELFEKKVIAIKNRLVSDISISDEELEKKYLEEIEATRTLVLEEVKKQIEELVKSQEQH